MNLCRITIESLVFLIGWWIHGTVCLTGLHLLALLIRLKQDWINYGIIKILYFRAQLQGTGSRSECLYLES